MNRREIFIATTAVLLGACAGATLAPVAANSKKALAPTVLGLAAAPHARAPHGKAEIHHLARGDEAYLGLLTLEGGAAVPLHRDATEEYIYVLEGRGHMTIDGQGYDVEPQTAVFMPANAEVSFQNGDARMVALQVFAGPEPSAKYEAWKAEP